MTKEEAAQKIRKLLQRNGRTEAEADTRSLTAGPFAFGSALDASLKFNGLVSHALLFAGALSLAQIKAVHNLLGYQYGLAIVP